MNPASIPEKPLIAKQGKVEQNERTFFFQRENGEIFFAKGEEAWAIYKGRMNIVGQERPRIKFIGSSDGSLYRKAVEEAQAIFRQSGLEKGQERLRTGIAEEIEAARGNMVYPQNFDTIDRYGRPADTRSIGL